MDKNPVSIGQFSFGKGRTGMIERNDDNSERVRVTIPIDWDEIIEKHIDQIS